jgi:chemotaxis protein MotB
VKDGEVPSERKIINIKPSMEDMLRLEKIKEVEKLKDLKKIIERAIDSNAKLRQFRNQILLDIYRRPAHTNC